MDGRGLGQQVGTRLMLYGIHDKKKGVDDPPEHPMIHNTASRHLVTFTALPRTAFRCPKTVRPVPRRGYYRQDGPHEDYVLFCTMSGTSTTYRSHQCNDSLVPSLSPIIFGGHCGPDRCRLPLNFFPDLPSGTVDASGSGCHVQP